MGVLRIFAVLFGLIFLAIGVMGYLPQFVMDGNLFGYFEVDSIHNMVHIVSGVLALLAAASASYSRIYFQLFGLIYGIVTLLGFVLGGDLFIMHVNLADNILHLGISLVSLYLGFLYRPSTY